MKREEKSRRDGPGSRLLPRKLTLAPGSSAASHGGGRLFGLQIMSRVIGCHDVANTGPTQLQSERPLQAYGDFLNYVAAKENTVVGRPASLSVEQHAANRRLLASVYKARCWWIFTSAYCLLIRPEQGRSPLDPDEEGQSTAPSRE